MNIIEYMCHMCVCYNMCVCVSVCVCLFFTVIYLYHIICSIRTHFGVSVRKTLSGPQSPTLCSFLITGCNSRYEMYEDFKFWGSIFEIQRSCCSCLALLGASVALFSRSDVGPCTTSSAVIRCRRIAAGEAAHRAVGIPNRSWP